MNSSDKRERLINAAAVLFHHKGFVATSLADIAKDADIPIGNVYYYFKTKEELAISALLRHREQCIARCLELNETIDDPRLRLIKSIDYYEENVEEFVRYGCPVVKITMDSDMRDGAISKATEEVFTCQAKWLEAQFLELGYGEQAIDHAHSLLSSIHGATIIAKSLQDSQILLKELKRIVRLIENMPNKRINLGKHGMKRSSAAAID